MTNPLSENKIAEQNLINSIIRDFAEAVKINNISLIENLLADDGSFQISMPNAERLSVPKEEYLIYLKELVNNTKVENYNYDQCLYCNAGGRVILFNGGRFPFNDLLNHDKREKTGFMLAITDGQVKEIRYCYSFLKSDNKPQFEVSADRIKQLMNDNNWDFDRAYDEVFKNK